MNGNGYLKLVLTVLTVAVIALGVMLINAVDRMHASHLAVVDKLTEFQELLHNTPGPAWEAREFQVAPVEAPIANREFYDPNAVPGGRLISAISAETDNLNYLICNESNVSIFNALCNDSLGARNYEHPEQFEPLLAESWTVSEDGRTIHIKLRKGILWHDFTDPVSGKRWSNVEVTADDFLFFLEVLRNPQVNCAPLRAYFQDLESITKINDYEFVVKWKNQYFRTLELTLGLSPMPRHLYHDYDGPFDGEKFNLDHLRNRIIVGCGPYRFVRWDKDQRLLFTRFEKYFGAQYGIAPPLKDLAFEVIKHPNTQYQSLLAGSLDWLGLTPEQWTNRISGDKRFEEGGDLRKIQYLAQAYSYIGYNLRNPLFQDKRVRQALTYLVDREKIKKDVYLDLAQIISGPFFYDSPYNDPSIKPYPFDVEKAKALLKAAGWSDTDGDGILDKDGRKFEFAMMQIADQPIQQRMLPIIKEDMAKAGIDMKISTFEWSVYLQKLNERSYDACTLAWTMPFEADPYQVWHSSQADLPDGSNHIGFKNPEADRLIEEIRRTTDVGVRIELCHQFQALLHEEQPYTFLFSPYALLAVSGRYENVRVFADGVPKLILWVPKDKQLRIPGL
ncbi:peptide-binding protein [Victivallis sp. Marseille-Q1083]|uniref:peptide-binding protein n=1 Tax=Victivallis sp. Marseille-Q1083 TaxID=2717288 RepID=UPI00158B5711|nr:peptide-binding protein [Victivallis sp. Marseille-Q1083]